MSAYGYERTYSRPKSTSAIPPTTDILAARLAFALFSSAVPPGTDLPGGAPERPVLTQRRPTGDEV